MSESKRYSVWYRVRQYSEDAVHYKRVKDVEGDWLTVRQLFTDYAKHGTGSTFYLTDADLTDFPENFYSYAFFPTPLSTIGRKYRR